MIVEYGKQVRAFFHFMFKHFFELEFAIRVFVEVLLFMALAYMLLKGIHIIISKGRIVTRFLNCELVMPLRVRLFEKLAFSTNNPNWQERANKIKDAFKGKKIGQKEEASERGYAGYWAFVYLFLVLWIIGFHYLGEEKRNSYDVFFLGENGILEFEEWFTYTLLETDEFTTECFFHDQIEINWEEIFSEDQ